MTQPDSPRGEVKLTRSQLLHLRSLNNGNVFMRGSHPSLFALKRRGLAQFKLAGTFTAQWAITDAGRAALKVDLCTKDGHPCHVGADTDDAHWRCGTVACGMRAALKATERSDG